MSVTLLRQLLMKEAVKKSAGSSGIMTINKGIAADVEKIVQKYVNDALAQGVDLDTLGPEQLKMIVQMNKPKTPQIISANSPEGRDMTKKLMSFLDRQSGDNVVDLAGKKIDTSQGIMGGKSVKELMDSGKVQKGTDGLKKNDKILEREMFNNSNLNETDAQIKARLEAGNKKSVKKMGDNRQMNNEELEYFEQEVGDNIDAYDFDGTVGSGKQIMKAIKDYEADMFAEYKSIGGPRRPGGPKASERDSMPIRLMKNFEKKLNQADLMAEGYSKDQANVLIKARKKMTSGEEMNPNESLLRVKEEFADEAGVDVDDFTDIDFEIDIPDYAKGGRAGFYTGGMVDVEPNLSDIGHGSDALMARTRLVAPDSQATTSTGLNYLLAEDNDNIRVPFSDAGFVDEALAHYNQYLASRKARPPKKRYKEIPFLKFFEEFSKENRAEGGRIGFSAGGGGRRAFLKLLATLGGGIAGVKSGILSLGGKEAGKKAVTETIKQSAGSGTPPPYFFKLVEKIKNLGDDVTVGSSTMPRTKVTRYKDYELTESLDGSKQIQKIGKENDMITKDEYMTYTKGQADETTKGKKVADDYEEVTEVNSRIYKDNYNDPDYEDGIQLKEILEEVGETVTKKADGGRIGFSAGKLALSKLGITGTSRRFLEKVFGKEKFATIIENDPEMHRGMLEVVEMFRNKDKSGLVDYMQNFLPQMSKKELETFIKSSGDTAGIEGQLIRLGSGRDYRNKLDMIEEFKNTKKLEDFDIEDVSKNAEGGRIGFSGGGIYRVIIANSAKKAGMKPYEYIKKTSYKSLPPEVKMFLSADDFARLKSGQQDLYSNYIDMAKTRFNFQKEIEGGKKTPAKELFESMEKNMDEQSYVPKNVNEKDIGEMEIMFRNRFLKDRKDNAQGGLQTMLGE